MVEMNVFVRVIDSPVCGFDVVFTLPCGSEVRYSSVFCHRDDAEAFADRVNRLGVSPIHIPDIVEDALM